MPGWVWPLAGPPRKDRRRAANRRGEPGRTLAGTATAIACYAEIEPQPATTTPEEGPIPVNYPKTYKLWGNLLWLLSRKGKSRDSRFRLTIYRERSQGSTEPQNPRRLP